MKKEYKTPGLKEYKRPESIEPMLLGKDTPCDWFYGGTNCHFWYIW